MQPQILVVSDPPHSEVDHDAAATALGLEVGDARLKVNFRAPEILAASDHGRASEVAAALGLAGLTVRVLDGVALASVPWPRLVTRFSLASGAMLVQLGEDEIVLPLDLPTLAVYCKPPAEFPYRGPDGGGGEATFPDAHSGLAAAESIQWMSTLDLFFAQGSSIQRITFARDVTDFAGLGEQRTGDATHDLAAALELLRTRFTSLTVDERLEDVRPRKRFVMGDDSFDLDMRKRFSFGTLLLRQVLDSISPEVRDLTQWELGVRLAYLLRPIV